MLFDRTQTVAPPGYSRWMVPPAALAVHLSIGQAYAACSAARRTTGAWSS